MHSICYPESQNNTPGRRNQVRARIRFTHWLLLASLLWLTACSSILRNPVPEEYHLETTVLERDDLRFWGDRQGTGQHPAFELATSDPEALEQRFGSIMHREHNYLAISGGGANGAYGAGILSGWSATGKRPEFTLVTGVSTGALTAPFAFLGPEYDQQLKILYTTLDTSSIFIRRSLFSIVRGDSLVDSAPLATMLDRYITREMVAEIAREYRRGRSLFVITTNLDASRPVVWNITRIADSGHPDAPALIRKVLLASASIPGVFPPQYLRVQTPDGKTYDEMHVDGGTSAQIFLYPSNANWRGLLDILQVKGTPTAYLLRNSRFITDYDPVRARLQDIAGRSVASLIRTQGVGDTYRITALANRDGVDVKLTWIPATAIRDPGDEVFDPEYMSALFDYGYQRAIGGNAWSEISIDQMGAVEIK
jgi:predicted patatin/cPLA2 family phospholipase